MTPKTTREHIISLHGHVTGLKKDMNNDIRGLGSKIDKVYWILLATVGAVAFQLINLLIKTI
jgi:hypothetical protein